MSPYDQHKADEAARYERERRQESIEDLVVALIWIAAKLAVIGIVGWIAGHFLIKFW